MRIGAEQFSGRSGIERRDDNLHAIYRWLVTFHFTTRALIAGAVGLKASPVRLLRWAERAGLLAWHRYPTYAEPLLMLTEHGRREAAMLYPQALQYRSRVTSVRMIEIAHDLWVQRVVLAEGLALDALNPARLIDLPGFKIPDLLVQHDDAWAAMEVELTVKSRQRIYIGFTDHLRAIGAGQYQSVRYLFARQAMAALYRGLFEADTWPRYVYVRRKRVHVIDPTRPKFSLKELPGMAERFSFEVHPALAVAGSARPHPISHGTVSNAQAQAPA